MNEENGSGLQIGLVREFWALTLDELVRGDITLGQAHVRLGDIGRKLGAHPVDVLKAEAEEVKRAEALKRDRVVLDALCRVRIEDVCKQMGDIIPDGDQWLIYIGAMPHPVNAIAMDGTWHDAGGGCFRVARSAQGLQGGLPDQLLIMGKMGEVDRLEVEHLQSRMAL